MAQTRRKTKPGRGSQIPIFEGPGKRHYVNRLKWLLDFLNTDIFSLPPGGFLKIFYEFVLFFYEGYVEDEILKEVCCDKNGDRAQVKQAQDFLSGCLSEIVNKTFWSERFESRPELRDDPLYSWIREDVEKKKVWEDDEPIPLAYHVRGERIILAPEIRIYRYDHLRDEDEITAVREFESRCQFLATPIFPWYQPSVPLGKFSRFCDPNMHAALRFGLYWLLEKFPLSCIGQCIGCSKYMIVTSKKRRPFCTRCLKKQDVYKWRKRNRDIYNTYQRNLQKGIPISVRELRKRQGEGHEQTGG